MTALMCSVSDPDDFYDADHAEITRLLLDAGADISKRDASLQTALHHAASPGAGLVAVTLLVNAGAEVDAVDRDGETALHLAAAQGLSPPWLRCWIVALTLSVTAPGAARWT